MSGPTSIALTLIDPREDQPRRHFDEQAIEALADSIRSQGFIGQVTVRRKAGGRFELLAGHRRRRAALQAGLSEVPAVVADLDDQQAREFVLLDNLNREDLLPWEEGLGFAELVAAGVSTAVVGQKAGRSVGYVEGRIRLHLQAGELAREEFVAGRLTLGALEAATGLPDRVLSPVRCPSCEGINSEGAQVCGGCATDLGGTLKWPSGNPQEVLVRRLRDRPGADLKTEAERVQAAYGLGRQVVQTALGLDDVRLPLAAVRARSGWERRLDQVARLSEWAVKHTEELTKLTGDQLATVLAQGRAVQRAGERVCAWVEAEITKRER